MVGSARAAAGYHNQSNKGRWKMIQEFADRYIAARPAFEEWARRSAPKNYAQIVKKVIQLVKGEEEYGVPDPERITEIDHGDYQGTLVYVIAAAGYQPSEYWYVKIWYGSCSGCDTLEGIRTWDDTVGDEELAQYWTLGLHIVQGLKKMGDHA